MKLFSKILFTSGIIMMIGGMAAAGLTYRDMKEQNLLHARTDALQFDLAQSSGWKTATFGLYQEGNHVLFLSATDTSASPSSGDDGLEAETNGQLEAFIYGPSGQEFLHKWYPFEPVHLRRDRGAAWAALDTLKIGETFSGVWTLRARVTHPAAKMGPSPAEVFILPPQKYEIGRYLSGELFRVIGFGVAMMAGFSLMVVGGILRRKAPGRAPNPR